MSGPWPGSFYPEDDREHPSEAAMDAAYGDLGLSEADIRTLEEKEEDEGPFLPEDEELSPADME